MESYIDVVCTLIHESYIHSTYQIGAVYIGLMDKRTHYADYRIARP